MPTLRLGSHDEIVIEERDPITDESREVFDRFEFALSALEIVRPPRMTVAVCRGRSRLRVEAGRAWGKGEGARWALVSIPPRASREAIALALASLVGPDARPYVLDVLLAETRAASDPGTHEMRRRRP
jgi:hypothetical protein